jgi:Tfp pilus assembly protein PilO
MKEKLSRLIADFDVREKSGVIIAVILVWLGLNLTFAFAVNMPRARRVAQLDESVLSTGSALTTRMRDVKSLREHHARVLTGNESLDLFYSDILSTKGQRLISFQREIREIAVRFNISLETITYRRDTFTKDKVAKFTASMPLNGSYENLREFIDTIERSENFIIIDSIQLTSSKEGGVILSLLIQASTYFVDDEIPETEQPGGAAG